MRVRSARKDSERLQRETSWGVLLEEGWGGPWPPLPLACCGCRHGARSRIGICFADCCFTCRVADLRAVPAVTSISSSRLVPGVDPSLRGASQEWQAPCSHSVGLEPHVWGSSCHPTNGTDTTRLCWGPCVNGFMWCIWGDSLLALGSLQKLQGVKAGGCWARSSSFSLVMLD